MEATMRPSRTLFFLFSVCFAMSWTLPTPASADETQRKTSHFEHCRMKPKSISIFGPKEYARTTGNYDDYFDSFKGMVGPGKVIIRNGGEGGQNRVTDAEVVFNGNRLIGFHALKHFDHEITIRVRLAADDNISVSVHGKPGSYITIQFMAEVTPNAAATKTVGIDGGTVSVQNGLGDTVTLEIPPLALGVPTPISVSVLPVPLPGPIANNVHPGAILEPEGQQFSLPIRVSLLPHNLTSGAPSAGLYWWMSPDYVLSLGNQTASQNGLSAQTYHFSPVFAGAPSEDE